MTAMNDFSSSLYKRLNVEAKLTNYMNLELCEADFDFLRLLQLLTLCNPYVFINHYPQTTAIFGLYF